LYSKECIFIFIFIFTISSSNLSLSEDSQNWFCCRKLLPAFKNYFSLSLPPLPISSSLFLSLPIPFVFPLPPYFYHPSITLNPASHFLFFLLSISLCFFNFLLISFFSVFFSICYLFIFSFFVFSFLISLVTLLLCNSVFMSITVNFICMCVSHCFLYPSVVKQMSSPK
jgi:hypothetical protein